MLGLGVGELLLIGAVGMLLFGSKRLPELGSSMGKAITNFKKGLSEHSVDKEEESSQRPTEKLPPS